MDWTPLADDDPLPGDAPAVESMARRFRALAEALEGEAGRVSGVDPGPAWVGLAAERFAGARDHLAPQLRGVARRFGLAAGALDAWAADIGATQQAGLRARDRARQAEQEQDLDVADAPARLAEAHRDFARIVADHRHAATRAAQLLGGADEVLDDPTWASGAVGAMLVRLLTGPDQFAFVVTDHGLVLNTPASWRREAYRQAGIDPATWLPSRGLAELDEVAVRAWGLYADLYERRPDRFLWAGMATLAGGTFYAAFQDLHVLRRGLEDGSVAADEVGDVLQRMYPGLPGPVLRDLVDRVARDAATFAREVRHVETAFLDMQRQIFDDLAWQHLAYEQGGLDAMEALRGREAISRLQVGAWRDIDSGEPDRVFRGNRELLWWEQQRIIGDDYDRVREHGPVTWALTMGMSMVAHSPVPGGRPFREVVPYEVVADTPDRVPVVPDRLVPDQVPFTDVEVPLGGGVYVDTPDEVHVLDLPLQNVSIFEHRWQWIRADMLPAWRQHVDAGTAGVLVSEPLAQQAARQRILPDGVFPYEPERR